MKTLTKIELLEDKLKSLFEKMLNDKNFFYLEDILIMQSDLYSIERDLWREENK